MLMGSPKIIGENSQNEDLKGSGMRAGIPSRAREEISTMKVPNLNALNLAHEVEVLFFIIARGRRLVRAHQDAIEEEEINKEHGLGDNKLGLLLGREHYRSLYLCPEEMRYSQYDTL